MDQIVIVNRQDNQIVWSHSLEAGQECNSVVSTRGGDVAYSYKRGAKLIDKSGATIFDYKLSSQNEEVQSICEVKGGYLVGVCGFPARLVELDKRGEVMREVKYDTRIKELHGQFRQIRKSKQGSYLIPLLGRNSVVEIDAEGKQLNEFMLGESPFSVAITKDGRYLAPCGHSGKVFCIDPESGDVTVLFSNETIGNEANIEFGAQITELRNGNLLLANWLGHNGDLTQPILIETDREGKVVGTLKNEIAGVSFVSAVHPIY